jgi:hypothetical protein
LLVERFVLSPTSTIDTSPVRNTVTQIHPLPSVGKLISNAQVTELWNEITFGISPGLLEAE